MWLTSNKPARVRTAMCAARMPEYSTGISHPPKFTILAPVDRWTAFKAGLRSSAVAGVVKENFLQVGSNIETSMRVFECQGRRSCWEVCRTLIDHPTDIHTYGEVLRRFTVLQIIGAEISFSVSARAIKSDFYEDISNRAREHSLPSKSR